MINAVAPPMRESPDAIGGRLGYGDAGAWGTLGFGDTRRRHPTFRQAPI